MDNLPIPVSALWSEIHPIFRDGTHASMAWPRFLCFCFLSPLVLWACLCAFVVVFAAFFDAVCCLAPLSKILLIFAVILGWAVTFFLHFVRVFPLFSLHFSGVPPLFF